MQAKTNMSDVTNDIKGWKGVGEYIIVQSHTGELVAGVKSVIKARELSDEIRSMCEELLKRIDALKLQLICNTSGELDRVEAYCVRRFSKDK